jgi:hypothetical protein
MEIKINANCKNEFSSMIDTCANNEEDVQHKFLFTALDNAKYIGGKAKTSIVELNPEQLDLFIHFIVRQMDFMEEVTKWEMKDNDATLKEMKRLRYDIWCLGKLLKQCQELVAVPV